jgi:uncharacterized protein YlxW (UPF0749 family)
MEESLKSRVILILGITTIIFFIFAVGSCGNASRMKGARDKEMATRLDLEEKMSKYTQDKTRLDDKLKNTASALEEEKNAHQATKKTLLQEQLVSQSLKEEILKVTKLKEALEDDLKKCLAGGGKKTRKQ